MHYITASKYAFSIALLLHHVNILISHITIQCALHSCETINEVQLWSDLIKDASGCRRLRGEAARLPPPKKKLLHKYRDRDGSVTVTPSIVWLTLNAATSLDYPGSALWRQPFVALIFAWMQSGVLIVTEIMHAPRFLVCSVSQWWCIQSASASGDVFCQSVLVYSVSLSQW